MVSKLASKPHADSNYYDSRRGFTDEDIDYIDNQCNNDCENGKWVDSDYEKHNIDDNGDHGDYDNADEKRESSLARLRQ